MTTQLLGVVGWSGSGKTTLLEYLVSHLSAQGVVVNVVKHSHHDIFLEPARKDSARLRQSGAAEVMLASPYRYALVHELREQPEPSLAELLTHMAPADLILVEGYKWAPIAKLEVHRPSIGKPAIYPDDPYIIAVASDVAATDVATTDVAVRPALTWLDLNQPEAVLQWLLFAMRENLLPISR
jgi:molybdopterin-guanine dinucleotide biosynthesis protein B